MAGIDTPLEWSAEHNGRNVWSKWCLGGSPEVRAVADAALSGAPLGRPGGTDPLLAGLTALARHDHRDAEQVLSAAAASDDSGLCWTALGDVYALAGDWESALDSTERAVEQAGGEAATVAVIGRAVAAIATGAAGTAVVDLRDLCRRMPGSPVLCHYLALALLCRATEVRAIGRDERPVIITAAQLASCSAISTEISGLPLHDEDLLQASAWLANEVRTSGAWRWRETGANGGVLAGVLLLAALGVSLGVLLGNVSVTVAAALVGAAGVFLYVATHRRPAWELRAQDMASLVTRQGS
jgi:hypothetical protein